MDIIFIPVLLTVVSIIRVVTTLFRPISEWILNFLYLIVVGRTKILPPIKNRILLMSATELAEDIRTRRLTSEEVVRTFIERCKEIHPLINAQTDERFEEAIKEAIEVDRALDKKTVSDDKLLAELPFLGVPFSVKDCIGIEGLKQSNGSVQYKSHKATGDAAVVMRLRHSGAIPIVVTNVPEHSMWLETANHVDGWTKNPYDNRRTVGGSTGGEASLITSCGSVIGLGSDMAGSIRIPASFCGIYGHRPSRGLISNDTSWPEDLSDTDLFLSTGPMCRYVKDLPTLTRFLAGNNAKKVPWERNVNFRKVKIFYMDQFPGWLLSATKDIKAAVRKAVTYFEEEFNSQTTQIYVPEMQYGFDIWDCKILETGAKSFNSTLAAPRRRISIWWEFFKSLFRLSNHTWPSLYYAAQQRQTKDKYYYECLQKYSDLERKLKQYLKGDAILLLPTHPDPPPHYLMTIPKYPNIAYTCIFNILGYPVTQIPAGFSYGVPIGIQAISTNYKDHLTLAAATELDRLFRGWVSPCPVDIPEEEF